MTFRQALVRALRIKLTMFACLCAYLIPMEMAGAFDVVKPTDTTAEQATFLAALYGCWNGPAPADMAGKMPGAMVTTGAEYVTDPERVRVALERGLAGQDTEAAYFCRGGQR